MKISISRSSGVDRRRRVRRRRVARRAAPCHVRASRRGSTGTSRSPQQVGVRRVGEHDLARRRARRRAASAAPRRVGLSPTTTWPPSAAPPSRNANSGHVVQQHADVRRPSGPAAARRAPAARTPTRATTSAQVQDRSSNSSPGRSSSARASSWSRTRHRLDQAGFGRQAPRPIVSACSVAPPKSELEALGAS